MRTETIEKKSEESVEKKEIQHSFNKTSRRSRYSVLRKTQEELDVEDRIKRGFYGRRIKTGEFIIQPRESVMERDKRRVLEMTFDKKFKQDEKYTEKHQYIPIKNRGRYNDDKLAWVNKRMRNK